MAGSNGKADVLDLDSIRPEKRTVRLNGKEIDVSNVPFEVFLDIADNLDKLQALGAVDGSGQINAEGADFRGALELLRSAAIKVLNASPGKPSTKEIAALDMFQTYELILFIVRPFFERIGDSKNLLATGLRTG